MGSKGHKKSSPSTQPINSISNQVTRKPHNNNKTHPILTRCPHVYLIENADNDLEGLVRRKINLQLKKVKCDSEDDESNAPDSELHCDECSQSKNLWLCLRTDCSFIGCGGNSKHSTLHAHNLFHPMAINLGTRAIWCEFCNNRIVVGNNNPAFLFEKNGLVEPESEQRYDDLELINYLDQDCNRSSLLTHIFGLNKKQTKASSHKGSNNLFNYAADSNSDEDESTHDKLNSYFMQEDDYTSKSKDRRDGLVGLDNLGNTCYMSAAIQCLSNCFSLTSYFLECSDYIDMRIVHKSNYFEAYSTTNSNNANNSMLPCLSLAYGKLVRELWVRGGQKMKHRGAITPSEFVQVVKYLNGMFRGYMQHDSQEFLIYLMDQIHEELKRPVYDGLYTDEDMNSESGSNGEDMENDVKELELEVDSGIHRLSIKSTQSTTSDSADSFETCQMDLDDIKPTKPRDNNNQPKPKYTSIMSEMFEGRLIGQVQCLECKHISTTTESFWHLSLPIPSREHLQSLQAKVNDEVVGQGWISWMGDMLKSMVWTQTIKLQECLTAFFGQDDLKGDNMYSCEKCKKLTNGVKYSKLLDLPETLIIHLKRFRHDSMLSPGKISSYVSFPLDELDMQPYLHDTKDKKRHRKLDTMYELCSIICHYGGANGGHYIAYARNHLKDEWYEYDDSYCKQVDFMTVTNAQAYVLFYRRKSTHIDNIKDQLRAQIIHATSLTHNNSLLHSNFISKQWLHKLKYFAQPGPIDNTDFLCKHNRVQPCLWGKVESMVVVCSTDTWQYLLKTFGMKRLKDNDNDIDLDNDYDHNFGVCNYLYPCGQCQVEDELMKQRQIFEKHEFLRLTDKTRINLPNKSSSKMYAISSVWYRQWEQFVQFKHCPQKHQIPGPIQNLNICNQQMAKTKVYQLNKNANNYKLNEDVWHFLHAIYGGGPELIVNGVNSTTRQTLRTLSTSSCSSMKMT